MDRFKFRAWSVHYECMFYSDEQSEDGWFEFNGMGILSANGVFGETPGDQFNPPESNVEEYDVVMQCTGLKDKNGVLIYEKDILSHTRCDEYETSTTLWNVIFNEDRACFNLVGGIDNYNILPATKGRCMDFEIIGNIYENPELLEA